MVVVAPFLVLALVVWAEAPSSAQVDSSDWVRSPRMTREFVALVVKGAVVVVLQRVPQEVPQRVQQPPLPVELQLGHEWAVLQVRVCQGQE